MSLSIVSQQLVQNQMDAAEKLAERSLSMSEDSVVRDLFDRWERVWQKCRYGLTAECVVPISIRHDE